MKKKNVKSKSASKKKLRNMYGNKLSSFLIVDARDGVDKALKMGQVTTESPSLIYKLHNKYKIIFRAA